MSGPSGPEPAPGILERPLSTAFPSQAEYAGYWFLKRWGAAGVSRPLRRTGAQAECRIVPVRFFAWGMGRVAAGEKTFPDRWARLRNGPPDQDPSPLREAALSRRAFFTRLSTPFAGRSVVFADVSRTGVLTFHLIGEGKSKSYFNAIRRIDIDAGDAFHNMVFFNPDRFGSAVAARILEALVALYGDVGVRRIRANAGLSGGGGVWPQYGFLPISPREDKKAKQFVRKNIERNARRLGDHLDYARQLVNDESPVWIRTMALWRVGEGEPEFRAYRRKGDKEEQQIETVGAWLLAGSRWKGVLDLEKQTSRNRLNRMIREQIDKSAAGR